MPQSGQDPEEHCAKREVNNLERNLTQAENEVTLAIESNEQPINIVYWLTLEKIQGPR